MTSTGSYLKNLTLWGLDVTKGSLVILKIIPRIKTVSSILNKCFSTFARDDCKIFF